MKWIYGKQDFKTLERGEENCYLMTNGLGGFSSLAMPGSAARNDHALLMACMQAPNHRYNVIHRLREKLEDTVISSQEFADGVREEGYRYLDSFTYEDTPVWTFRTGGVEMKKEAALKYGENTLALRYEIYNGRRKDVTFSVTPFCQFVPKGMDVKKEQEVRIVRLSKRSEGADGQTKTSVVESGDICLSMETNGKIKVIPEERETYFYRLDACDGRRENGTAWAVQTVEITVGAGKRACLDILFKTEEEVESARPLDDRVTGILEDVKAFRDEAEQRAGFTHPLAKVLSRNVSQFVADRASTEGKTILAGFPFFEDWGRDTMIALPGVCISTGQYETAKEILRTFAVYEKDGLMPNLFPEGGNAPMYNTVDASLLFINCVYLLYRRTKDAAFVRETYPVMERIIEGYVKGTDYGIYLDEDGLIHAGEGLAQVTWMDVRVGEILPTPRHGKPVEINAYWYNALKIMEALAEAAEEGEEKVPLKKVRMPEEYAAMAERTKEAFCRKFWLEEQHCLKDVLSGTKADAQIRCNQIWAVSMPFTMLDKDRERQVVKTVFEKLYTPYGLRTLAMDDEEFHPFYGGALMDRDMAYHQGTVWTFPLGAYYLAYLKVHDYSREAKRGVAEQMEVLESAMREGCIGQFPEIYDGAVPTSSRGCFAQAWSVGEILRVYEALEA